MAKLKAHGRTVYRLEKRVTNLNPTLEVTASNLMADVEWDHYTRVLMSDGCVLQKHKWKSLRWDKPFDTGWKLLQRQAGKVINFNQWLSDKLAQGWAEVK